MEPPLPGGIVPRGQLSPGRSAAPGLPWPLGWVAAPASWLSSPGRPRRSSHFLAGTSHSGTVTWQAIACHRRPVALGIGGREERRQRRGGGRGAPGRGRRAAAEASRLPSFAGSLFSATADPRTPHCPRHPTTTRKCRHQTRPSGKLVERRAAGCQHLIAPERWLATPEEPGFHSTAVRHPRTRTAAGPRGLPARCSARQVQKQQQQ